MALFKLQSPLLRVSDLGCSFQSYITLAHCYALIVVMPRLLFSNNNRPLNYSFVLSRRLFIIVDREYG